MFHCLFYFLFYYYYFYLFIFFFFALSIERTCPDLHFTTDYTLYDVYVTNNKEPWVSRERYFNLRDVILAK